MSVSEFFAMGGYAFFVWGSYGVTAAFILIELLLVMNKKRSLLHSIFRAAKLNRE